MAKQSAGILLYRIKKGSPEVFLVHPGGPFFIKKDEGAWSIPKGEFQDDEPALTAAKREFLEETGIAITGEPVALTPIRQKSGKYVYAFAVKQDLDPAVIKSNLFEMEWPPKSGKMKSFPEIDRGDWFSPEIAVQKINPAQAALIQQLLDLL